ncbi:MAG: hypothetical protein ABEJ42_06610 [Halobacteriaceae archaeon]
MTRWFEAPRSWYEQNQQAKRVLERNGREDDDNVVGCGLGSTSEKTFGGWNGRTIHYDVLDESAFDVPDEIEGIPVTVSESGPGQELCGCYNDHQYSSIPGGASWGLKGTGGWMELPVHGQFATAQTYILTANHVMADPDCNGTSGNTGKQCGNDVGDVEYYNTEEEWALVQDTYVPASNKIDNTDFLRDLKGHVTQSGLDRLESNGSTSTKREQPPEIRTATSRTRTTTTRMDVEI